MKKCLFFVVLILQIILILSFCGCRSVSVEAEAGVGYGYEERHGPPAHAPAHGYRRNHSYVYYPESRIYFDMSRRLYFYFELGVWKSAISLPSHIHLIKSGSVSISMNTDKPYLMIHEHQRKYPPGKAKKVKNTHKGKAKGKWK